MKVTTSVIPNQTKKVREIHIHNHIHIHIPAFGHLLGYDYDYDYDYDAEVWQAMAKATWSYKIRCIDKTVGA